VGAVAHHGDELAGDGTLEGRLLPELGVEAADRTHVQTAAGDVLGAGVVAALEHHDLGAGAGESVRGRQACETTTDDDALDLFHAASPDERGAGGGIAARPIVGQCAVPLRHTAR